MICVLNIITSQNSIFYICSGCQAFYEQPLGKVVEKVSDKTGQTNLLYRQQTGPPVDGKCPECDSALHVGVNFVCIKIICLLLIL